MKKETQKIENKNRKQERKTKYKKWEKYFILKNLYKKGKSKCHI